MILHLSEVNHIRNKGALPQSHELIHLLEIIYPWARPVIIINYIVNT